MIEFCSTYAINVPDKNGEDGDTVSVRACMGIWDPKGTGSVSDGGQCTINMDVVDYISPFWPNFKTISQHALKATRSHQKQLRKMKTKN